METGVGVMVQRCRKAAVEEIEVMFARIDHEVVFYCTYKQYDA